jgi:hypothetical protein
MELCPLNPHQGSALDLQGGLQTCKYCLIKRVSGKYVKLSYWKAWQSKRELQQCRHAHIIDDVEDF